MPHVTFILPCVGRFPDTKYVRSWQMQPLAIGVLSRLTPPSWRRTFFDDRLEDIDYGAPTDLVAISTETYTARRAYQIAANYRKRGVKVVMGGCHPTFCPDEVLEHADSVCIGDAEDVWGRILADAERGTLERKYDGTARNPLGGVLPDRSIFEGKNYYSLALVEASRGCKYKCSFCSITAFHGATYRRRPPEEIVEEIRSIGAKIVFFVDDNIAGDLDSAKKLFEALIPLNIKWLSQASVAATTDPELMDLMARSGCAGVLVGFESLDRNTLKGYNKGVNLGVDFDRALAVLRDHGIVVYGTFMFGADSDRLDTVKKAVAYAKKERIFLAAFAHVVPFPGTPLYDEVLAKGSLIYDKWWLSDQYRFGDPPYRPDGMTPEELMGACHEARLDFYGIPSILARALDGKANCRTLNNAKVYFAANALLRSEVRRKKGLPLGAQGFNREV